MAPRTGTPAVLDRLTHVGYDVIIVGGGLSGLVLASRLSECRSKKILLLEAGASHIGDPRVDTPGLMATLWEDPEYDWGFLSEPQVHLGGRVIPQPRGKLLGGSSAVNYTAILYPTRRDFDAWTALGNKGWTFDDMMPYFRKFHTYEPASETTNDLLGLDAYIKATSQGHDGPLSVTHTDTYGPFNEAWNATFSSLDLEDTLDPIDCEKSGVFTPSNSIQQNGKKRSYAASAYYTEAVAARSNLSVLTEVLVTQIIFDDASEPVATGVRVQAKGGQQFDITGAQVILSAGAINSPKLLELSGVGSQQILEQHSIRPLVNNCGVGKNLQDHAFASMSFEVADNQSSGDILRDPELIGALLKQYQDSQSGPFSGMPISVTYLPGVDFDGQMASNVFASLIKKYLPETDKNRDTGFAAQCREIRSMLLDKNTSVFQSGFLSSQMHFNKTGKTAMGQTMAKLMPGNYVSFTASPNHPLSRGSVHVQSADPREAPRIDPNYLSHPLDLELTARCLQFVQKFAHTDPMAQLLKPANTLPPDVDLSDLEVAKQVARERLFTTFHPSCTCAMLPREQGGVVDDRCNVYGTRNVRVIDASIFPIITQGNIQATVYAMTERAADLVKEDWQ